MRALLAVNVPSVRWTVCLHSLFPLIGPMVIPEISNELPLCAVQLKPFVQDLRSILQHNFIPDVKHHALHGDYGPMGGKEVFRHTNTHR